MKLIACLCFVLLAGCGERWEYHQGYKKGVKDARDVKRAYPGQDCRDAELFDDGSWSTTSRKWNEGRRDGFREELAYPD